MRIKDKVSLIVGGTSGIGLATAKLFSQEGGKVAILGRDPDKGRAAIEEISRHHGDVIFVQSDASRLEDAERAITETIDVYGRIDVLFNNAGIVMIRDLTDMTEDEWDTMMAINLKSVFLMSKHTIPMMEKTGGGSIINTASILGLAASQGYAAYSASKAAIIVLTKTMALECVSKNIRVNCISPGSVKTNMLDWEMAYFSRHMGKPFDVVFTEHAQKTPLRRDGTPGEIAPLVLYLASDESSFVTGSNFVIDGGRLASFDSPPGPT
jgi:NAD(P)-dependent dehydrogenase (short-subunit alcohol dehydrogenase family)